MIASTTTREAEIRRNCEYFGGIGTADVRYLLEQLDRVRGELEAARLDGVRLDHCIALGYIPDFWRPEDRAGLLTRRDHIDESIRRTPSSSETSESEIRANG